MRPRMINTLPFSPRHLNEYLIQSLMFKKEYANERN